MELTQQPAAFTEMPTLPSVKGVCEVFATYDDCAMPHQSYFNGSTFKGCGSGSAETLNKYGLDYKKEIVRWRMVDPDPVSHSAPSAEPQNPADPLPVSEPSRICASDEDGIKAFVKPPEVVKAEVPQRVSTLNRAWRWL